MNRAWNSSVSMIVSFVLFASADALQTAGPPDASHAPQATSAKKGITPSKKGAGNNTKKDKKLSGGAGPTTAAPAGQLNPPPAQRDAGSQPVAQQQLNTVVTAQTQHARDLDSLKRDLESFKQEARSWKQDLDRETSESKRLALVGLEVELGSLVIVVIVIVVIFFRKNPLANLYQETLRQSNELKESYNILRDDFLQLKRGNKNFVTVENFEAYRKVIEQLQIEVPRLQKLGAASSGGGMDIEEEPPVRSWPQELPVQQHKTQTRSNFGAAYAQARVTIRYANMPDRDGYFRDANLKSKSEWDCLYRLTLDDSDLGTVEIFSGSERFEAAMKAAQDYLSPVCDYQSNPPTSAKRINQVSPGKIKREGQAWKIVAKLKIEFV